MKTSDISIDNSINAIEDIFPFKGYMERKHAKYSFFSSEILKLIPIGCKVLSVGAGPCDFEGILQNLGYQVTAIDDLNDYWHKVGNNSERIKQFAKRAGIDLHVTKAGEISELGSEYDLVMAIDVIEHICGEQRPFLNFLIEWAKPGGHILVATPNAAKLKNRINLIRGHSPYVDFGPYFWTMGEYRSHVREYTHDELYTALKWCNLEKISVKLVNIMIKEMQVESSEFKKTILLNIYDKISYAIPSFRDLLFAVATKPVNWIPVNPSIDHLIEHYPFIEEYNFENVDRIKLMELFEKRI